ncbi:MAG TPA: sulfotransferase [Candidatus Acidoferrales bacterium]|nr:sulfotransferase [Candidatus Acidoferrales bacterium]
MNQRRDTQFQGRSQPTIKWRGKKWTLAEAGALAGNEQSLGNFQAAADIFKLMLALMPGSPELHNNRGVMLQMAGRYAEALASYDRAVALKPDYALAHFNRGYTLNKLNRQEEALAGYDRAIVLKPDLANAHNNRGIILQALRRYDDAMASYRQALVANPGHAEASNNLGTTFLNQGKLAEAEEMFRKALELKADYPDPLFNLASLRKYQNADNAEVKNIRALLDKPGISPGDKEYLNFALGKIYDDCGRFDEAFECYRQANEIRNAMVAYNPDAVQKATDDILAVFSADFLAQPSPFALANRSPVFIVGMPRSGTTLFASVLSNHPDIAMAGELSTIGDLAAHLKEWTGSALAYPQAARQIKQSVAERVIADYEKRLRRDVGPAAPFVIDKNPLNFRHLGLIALLFPNARIIHCQRHPLDTCLSNYFQRFPLNLDYCFDLRNIGHFYREYVRLMEHWRKMPTLNLIEVSYEDMVSNTEKSARRILDFMGLEWDERCLTPHTNPNPVETASLWQVRQPIYGHALERWRHYEKHLAPLKESLAAAGVV